MLRRFLAGVCAIIFFTSQVTSTVHAVAEFDQTFFTGNDILFYDPTCEASAAAVAAVQLAGNDNTEKILNFFMRKGLSLAQASGIVGNMMQESGLNPAIVQGGRVIREDEDYTPQNGVGFGLVQWTFTSRQKPLQDHVRQMGVKITDLGGQLEFVWKELNGGYTKTLTALKSTEDPVQAAIYVHGPPSPGYEASADSPEKVRTVRGGNAKKVYDKYKDAPALAGSTAATAMNNPSTDDGDGHTAELTAAQNTPPKSDGCNNSFAGGNLNETLMAYAWDDYKGNDIKARDEYSNAVNRALSEKRYVGGIQHKGIDCGGFVTTLLYDSGFDKAYNSNAKGGATYAQEEWLKKNWHEISATDASDRQPGDVAINAQHTYMYVGDVPGFKSKIASASLDERAPMAGKEGVTDSSFRWYRINATGEKKSSDKDKATTNETNV